MAVSSLSGGLIALGVLVCLSAYLADPMIGTVVTLLAGLTLVALLHPAGSALCLGFLTAAFPKAGVKLSVGSGTNGGFPVPVFLFGLIIAVVLLVCATDGAPRPPRASRLTTTAALYFVWILGRIVLFRQSGGGLSDTLTLAAWAVLPIGMSLLGLHRLSDEMGRRFGLAIERGFILAGMYGLVQFVFGIDATSVPGLTIAYGDSYADKHDVIYSSAGDFSKLPSTYQSGNVFSIVAAFFLITVAVRLTRRRAHLHDLVLLTLSALSIGLSGSRTGIVSAVVGVLLVLVARRGSALKKVLLLLAGLVTYAVIGLLEPKLLARYTLSNVLSTGGAGRTTSWAHALGAYSPWQYVTGVSGSPDFTPTEGGLGLLQQIGLVGAVLLIVVAVLVTTDRPVWRIPLAALLVASAVDSAYLLFPTLFIPAARIITPIDPFAAPAAGEPDAPGVAVPAAAPATPAAQVGRLAVART